MGKHYAHLSFTDRITLEALYKNKHNQTEIAAYLGVHKSTISRELRRGRYMRRNGKDYSEREEYSPDIAEKRYRENLGAKGPDLKIGNDYALAEYLEQKIVDDGYSPEAALASIRKSNCSFSVTISKQTLYRYIDIGVFNRLSNKNLPVKRDKKKYKKVERKPPARASAGTSIEKRPEEIKDREEFGHWEMDTVKGKLGVSKKSLLVLTERKSRDEIITKLASHTTGAVVAVLDQLEKLWGDSFPTVFKSITVDNGVEFADCAGMERSALRDEKRTKLYYCHPYSSYERGSNEAQNRLIRRHIKKGSDFDRLPDAEIKRIEDWINNYPRRLFGYGTARQMFDHELAQLGLCAPAG